MELEIFIEPKDFLGVLYLYSIADEFIVYLLSFDSCSVVSLSLNYQLLI